MKNKIKEIARQKLIDEIRFIDAEALTEEHIGVSGLFAARQPKKIMPEAKSIILTSMYIGKFVSPVTDHHGRMSRLVLSGFYANIVQPLFPIRDFLQAEGYRAAIMDGSNSQNELPIKAAAVKAGLGWIGKNTLVVNEKYGSFQAFGAILTDADLGEEHEIAANRCGDCRKCMDACPSKAVQTPQHLTRPRCLSDILDGNEGEVSLSEVDQQGYFLECDICQDACPWNQRHIREPLDTPYGRLYDVNDVEPLLRLERLQELDKDSYRRDLAPLMGSGPIPYNVFKENLATMKQAK